MKFLNSEKLIEQLYLWDKRTGQWIKFKLWPIQKKWLYDLHRNERLIALKKRQVGFSQLSGADSLVQCMYNPNFTVLALSISADDAKVFLSRIRDMWKRILTPEEYYGLKKAGITFNQDEEFLIMLKQASPVTKGKDAGDEMVFQNGSSIVSLSAQKGRGRTADRVICDEAAFYTLKNSKITLKDVLKSIVPSLDRAEGQLIIISTANGINEYQKMYKAAEKKMNNYKAFFVSCWDDPDFTKSKRAQIVIDYGEDHANQEYPRTSHEAFLSSGRPRFDIKIIQEYYEPLAEEYPAIAKGNIIIDEKYRQKVEINPKGYITFYKKKDNRKQYVISADISEGIQQKGSNPDCTCAIVYELPEMEPAAIFYGMIEPALFGKILGYMGRHYNNAVLIPEANNHGIAVIAILRHNLKYPDALIHVSRKKRKEMEADKFETPEARFGFHTNISTRPVIVDNYAYKIHNKQIPWIPKENIDEHMSFIVNSKGKAEAEEGSHDDRILATCIGYYVGPYYIKKDPLDSEKCYECKYFKQKTKEAGWCIRSLRWSQENDHCRLFSQKVIWSPKKENPDNRYSTGYVPL